MQCIECGSAWTRVIDSRRMKNGRVIRRRRQCDNCLRRFTTYEIAEVILAKERINPCVIDSCLQLAEAEDTIFSDPVESEREGGGSSWWYVCGECHGEIGSSDVFCKGCGRRIKW